MQTAPVPAKGRGANETVQTAPVPAKGRGANETVQTAPVPAKGRGANETVQTAPVPACTLPLLMWHCAKQSSFTTLLLSSPQGKRLCL